jgi:hypothetical protein
MQCALTPATNRLKRSMIRSYSELIRIDTFEERFKYLALRAEVGSATFGFDRYMNQRFYMSSEWKHIRHHVVSRDNGCDLGIRGYEIYNRLIIHHMNPMTVEEVVHGDERILDPEFLITTTHKTHNAIHFGDSRLLPRSLVERKRGDTKLW